MVLINALLSPPVWKKHPQAMKPAHTRTKPASGPSARNAQTAPRTPMLRKERRAATWLTSPLELLVARPDERAGRAANTERPVDLVRPSTPNTGPTTEN